MIKFENGSSIKNISIQFYYIVPSLYFDVHFISIRYGKRILKLLV